MNILRFSAFSRRVIKAFFISSALLILASCGVGSSGGQGNANAVSTGGNGNNTPAPVASLGTKNYEGAAAPRDADVQNFRLFLWTNLASETRCGACHTPGGDAASLPFVRDDDINAAYDSIINYSINGALAIRKDAAPSSALVSYVRGGHNCWLGSEPLDANACADDIQGWIQQWIDASSPSSFLAALKQFAPESANAIKQGKRFTVGAPTEFSDLHNTLQTYCSDCHTPSSNQRQQPFFAVADADSAYEAIQSRIDINQTNNSRLYVRLAEESHNCWDDCTANSATMLANINTLVTAFTPQSLDPALVPVTSGGLTLSQGIILSNGNRVDEHAVGLWTFKEGQGVEAKNSASGGQEITLLLDGNIEWWGAGGVTINDGKLQAISGQSDHIYNALKATGEYSIEAWVIPLNVTQGENDPATIVTLSQTTERRNFMLSQQIYNYNFYNRNTKAGSNDTDLAGTPLLATPDNDEVAQASLQHVVATFSASEGRKIYVDGEVVASEPASEAGSFNEWSDAYSLIVGNEGADKHQWQGAVRLLAIHRKALDPVEITANYEVGVGDRYFLMFPIEGITGVPQDSYIVFQVEEFDQYSYLFSNPIFYNANETSPISGLTVKGLRIGINTQESESGQAYIRVNADINSSELVYIMEEGNGGMQALSQIGTVIPKQFGPQGVNADQFFVTFDEIGTVTYNRPVVTATAPAITPDDTTQQSRIGLKNFAEINASLSQLTGIAASDSRLLNINGDPLYQVLRQQMPSSENIQGFVSAQQMAVAQLAFKYCDLVVEDGGNSTINFNGFDFNAATNVAYNDNAKKDRIIAPLLANLLADDSADHSADQPAAGAFGTTGGTRNELSSLIDTMVGNNATTKNIAKATCAAAYGSAMMLLQ